MACESWMERIVERVCDEIEPDDGERLAAHLRECEACRTEMERLASARVALRENEPAVPLAPRVVVLEPRRAAGLVPSFAAGIAFGVLAIAAAFWAGRSLTVQPQDASAARSDSDFVRRADLEAVLASERQPFERRIDGAPAPLAVPSPAAPALTRTDFEAALKRFERKLESRRASDLDWLLHEIAASEQRTGARIGQTREALRYVALASDPRVTAQ